MIIITIKKILLIASFAMTMGLSAQAAEIYVSPSAESGGDGSISAPYATLEEARNYVRKINADMTEDIYVYLMDGTYNLSSYFYLSSSDSGKNGCKVIYKAYDGATPVISGGTDIDGLSLYDEDKNIWRASAKSKNSRHLYVNGVKAERAATNSTNELPTSLLTVTDSGYSISQSCDLLTYSNISDVEFVYKNSFRFTRMGVATVDSENKTITMDSGFASTNSTVKTKLIKIENAYELLDTPGEWYLNKSDGYIYYIPRQGEDMETANVVMPTVDRLVNAYSLKNVEFDGITFKNTTWMDIDGEKGYNAGQGGFPSYGLDFAFYGSFCQNITIKNCIFTGLGCGAIYMGDGTKNCLISKNEVYDCAGGGIYVEYRDVGNSSLIQEAYASRRLENNTICYNKVHDIGTELYGCVGILAAYSRNFLISNNDVYNAPYTGISVGWGWDDSGHDSKFKTNVFNYNNRIYRNHVHDVMQKMDDGAGIYVMNPQPGMEIQNNVVENLGGNHLSVAYYLDDGSRYILMKNNIGRNANVILYDKGRKGTAWYNNITDNYFDSNYLKKNLFDQTVAAKGYGSVIDNIVVTDGNYPVDILALAGADAEQLQIEFTGTTTPKKAVYYGLFNKNGVEKSEDIFYINEILADEYGKYSVTLGYDIGELSDFIAKTSENESDIIVKNPSEYEFAPYEFYDIYDANSSKTDNQVTVNTVFSGRNMSRDSVSVIAAIYNSEGVLVGMQSKDYAELATKFDTFTVDCTEFSGGYKVKVMMWDSLYGMKTLTEFFGIDVE